VPRLPTDDPATRTASGPGITPTRSGITRHTEQAIVVVIVGPDQGTTARFGPSPLVVGSASDCGLLLSDPAVSKRHLEVSLRGTGVALRDLGSKNGCFLGDRRFREETVPLGTEFRLGKSLLKVVPEEESLQPEPDARRSLGSLVGASAEMRRIFTLIHLVAPSEATILIEGETGTGKELVAEEVHRHSKRCDGPFVVFDCGAVPASLIESVLFGHVRGSFTGAVSDRAGVLEEANGGTLFLDELGELPLELQPALLRFLDDRSVQQVGSSRRRTVDVRVVAATNRDLAGMTEARLFREDLFYRLAVVRVMVPPLRERAGDIPHLIRHFLRGVGRPDLEPDPELLARLERHPWPGNVRELKSFVVRAAALGESLGLPALDALDPPDGPPAEVGVADRAPRPFRVAKAEAIESFERGYLADLIAEHPVVNAAAEAADMDRKHLAMLLRRYGLGGGS
jgi:transcriptional regulator with GAF, ATPase, and Fis domain